MISQHTNRTGWQPLCCCSPAPAPLGTSSFSSLPRAAAARCTGEHTLLLLLLQAMMLDTLSLSPPGEAITILRMTVIRNTFPFSPWRSNHFYTLLSSVPCTEIAFLSTRRSKHSSSLSSSTSSENNFLHPHLEWNTCPQLVAILFTPRRGTFRADAAAEKITHDDQFGSSRPNLSTQIFFLSGSLAGAKTCWQIPTCGSGIP